MKELRFSEYCANCRKRLEGLNQIFFVEKEIGRCFCSHECIQDYFQPTIQAMEEEHNKLLSRHDFTQEQRRSLAHHQPLTLAEPDEIWISSTENGEKYFTYISQFETQNGQKFHYIVVSLAIDNIPSFVFISFPTKDEELLTHYRKGTEISKTAQNALTADDFEKLHNDLRQPEDIPYEAFDRFAPYLDPSLDEPDEIWSFNDQKNKWVVFMARHVVRVIRESNDVEMQDFMMILITRFNKGQIEIVFAFPTIDPGLVQYFRKGTNSLNKLFGIGFTSGKAA
ncbi:MAG: PBECR2 nuclease fold domain-containing protein [Bacteriovoracia bacterium]